ncbi:UBP-type zinc finger domain-containing protein [Gordonia sp. ABSL1-1]|uniref:UBP-type zinc finger domain-containing protein n=1 Tax=Gordonia sp. ABSL1-1 TaxID=3053923 RepID=UPI002572728D|nr:UBP-type zinc finger domain-containing protein [Gordonia sp. ABSL1-1]MDL9938577.1 UBP-type zinc finger domain-containing protein [Gordonia sp. ABSL1-1]
MQIFRRNRADRAGRERGSTPTSCPELAAIGVDPSADPEPGAQRCCEDCVAMGEHHWAHLRKCLVCGHVSCCDSSPRRHATAHFEATGHPVMRSAEPGESWRWCYIHEAMG